MEKIKKKKKMSFGVFLFLLAISIFIVCMVSSVSEKGGWFFGIILGLLTLTNDVPQLFIDADETE